MRGDAVRRESNMVKQISFLGGRDASPDNHFSNEDSADQRRKFHFALKQGAVVEPQYFVRNTPTLTLREYKKLPFLGHLFAGRTAGNTRELSN